MSETIVANSETVDQTGTTILELEGIEKRFGDITAVNGANFEVADGEFFSIIGPSGSGKTTLLRMIAGFEFPTEGEIWLGDEQCTGVPPHERDVNMIFQNLALFPHLSVSENIGFGLRESGMQRTEIDVKIEEVLETMDLKGYGDRKISELSGGEQQRVALARSLVNEPSVLLLDEPLASLDRKLKETMKIELKEIQERTDTTFIYVTHDQDIAMAMSDRVAILNDGDVQQIASPEEIYRNPRNQFVADFTGAENIFEVDVVNQNGSLATVDLDGLTFQAASSNGAPSTGKSNFVVRPEMMTVSKSSGRIPARIEDLVYGRGHVNVITHVETDAGTRSFTAEVQFERGTSLTEGETVYLDWDEENALVIEK